MTQFAASVCVFCGAKTGNSPDFAAEARALGAALAQNNWRLIFGAGDQGIMGAVADAVHAENGASLGVIPTHLMPRERSGKPVASARDFVITENMHERKKVMFMNSDAIIVLPGGAGSMDEFFEVLTWRQIGLHQKPIFLLNTNGYWDPLIRLLDHLIAQGFAEAHVRDFVQVAQTVDEAVAGLRAALS